MGNAKRMRAMTRKADIRRVRGILGGLLIVLLLWTGSLALLHSHPDETHSGREHSCVLCLTLSHYVIVLSVSFFVLLLFPITRKPFPLSLGGFQNPSSLRLHLIRAPPG